MATGNKLKSLTDETDAATKRILALTDDTYNMGAATLTEMNEQKSKLSRIEEELDNIWKGLDDAESYLDELKELFGCLLLPCASTRQTSTKYDDKKMKSDQKPLKRKEKREATKAVDENLNKIRSNVSALRSMVLEMDTETDEQNDMLERINKKAKDNERRLQQTTDNAKLILDSNKPCKLM